jgi:hypothetical protein
MLNIRFTPPIKATVRSVRDNVKKELEGFSNDLLLNLKAETPIAKGRARRGWTKRSNRDKVKLVNTVPYIERLESNYSKQTQGQGITKPAINKTRAGRQRRIR